eukprot:535679-Pleurochrysis_carterae.AAC.1
MLMRPQIGSGAWSRAGRVQQCYLDYAPLVIRSDAAAAAVVQGEGITRATLHAVPGSVYATSSTVARRNRKDAALKV